MAIPGDKVHCTAFTRSGALPRKVLSGSADGTNRAFTGGDVVIMLTGTDRKFDDAMSAIVSFRPNR